ncbi:hypothetical protein EDD36DRAFT_486722 [Exophiala viscosa]|uniref:Uncharacterized protein n=1 Tax=Exophiala viscosa TaxID=2486360 RepID=A0AAN6DWI1_9EURO|nr:hypothetical protein EDD36DRAFT_486722 [Exophiala viscosa]
MSEPLFSLGKSLNASTISILRQIGRSLCARFPATSASPNDAGIISFKTRHTLGYIPKAEDHFAAPLPREASKPRNSNYRPAKVQTLVQPTSCVMIPNRRNAWLPHAEGAAPLDIGSSIVSESRYCQAMVLERTHLKHVTDLAVHAVIDVTGLSATSPYHAVGKEHVPTKSGNPYESANKRPYLGLARQNQEVLPDQNDSVIGRKSINHKQCTPFHESPYTSLMPRSFWQTNVMGCRKL